MRRRTPTDDPFEAAERRLHAHLVLAHGDALDALQGGAAGWELGEARLAKQIKTSVLNWPGSSYNTTAKTIPHIPLM